MEPMHDNSARSTMASHMEGRLKSSLGSGAKNKKRKKLKEMIKSYKK